MLCCILTNFSTLIVINSLTIRETHIINEFQGYILLRQRFSGNLNHNAYHNVFQKIEGDLKIFKISRQTLSNLKSYPGKCI